MKIETKKLIVKILNKNILDEGNKQLRKKLN